MEELYALRRYIETDDTTAALALFDELDEMSKDDKIQKIVSFMRMPSYHPRAPAHPSASAPNVAL